MRREHKIRRQASLGTEFRRVYNEDENKLKLMLATVTKVNLKFNTVDVRSVSGDTSLNKSGTASGMFSAKLPIQFGGRTLDGSPYGQTTPVDVGSLVLVGFVDGYKRAPVVLSVYNEADTAQELSRSPVDSIEFSDEDMKKHAQHQFTVYPSLTYDDIDGEGNRTVSFTGKTFFMTDSDYDPDIEGVTDDGVGTSYEALDSSYYYSGELIEPKDGRAPSLLFRHVGKVTDDSGNELPDDHVTMVHIAQDGTYRTSVLKEEEDWRSYLELSENGTIKLRRQNDSKAIGQGNDFHELSVGEDGIIFRSGDKYAIFNADGWSGAGMSGSGNYDADISDLKDGLLELGTNFEQTEEYIRMSATRVEEIGEQLVEFEATFEITAQKIEQRVSETVTAIYDEDIKSMREDINAINDGALDSLRRLEELSDDGVLTPLEKQTLALEINMVKAEYPNYRKQAELMELTTAGYDTAYNNFINFVEPLLIDMEESSNIDRTIFMQYARSYYNKRGELLYDVLDSIKSQLDVTAEEAIEAGKSALQALGDARDAKNSADRANDNLRDIADDGKITPQEKLELRKEYNRILAEWETYVGQAEEYEVDFTDYIQAKDELVNYIESNGILSNILETSTVNGTTFLDMFMNYYEERLNIIKGIQDATYRILLDYEGQLEHHETSITETSREITLMAQSIRIMERDIELNSATLSVQSDRISMRVSSIHMYREINSNIERLNSVGRNLFVGTRSGDGELNPDTGRVEFDRSDAVVSPYIQVEDVTNYILTAHDNKENNVITIAWYDATRNYLDGASISGTTDPLVLVDLSPLKAKYARVSTRNANGVKLQFEKGSVPKPYKASPEDMMENLEVAQEEYNSRKSLLSDYEIRARDIEYEGTIGLAEVEERSKDIVWSIADRDGVRAIVDKIKTWNPTVVGEADAYNVSSIAYQGAYASLIEHVDPLLENTDTNVPVNKYIVTRLFDDLYKQRNRIYKSIVRKLEESYLASEEVLDQVTESSLEAQRIAEQLAQEAEALARDAALIRASIDEAVQTETRIMTSVGEMATDSILSPTEKVYVNGFLQDIAEEVPNLITQANVYSLSTADLENAYSSLSSYVSAFLTTDVIREDSDIAPQTFINRFQSYLTAKNTLLENILDGANGRYEQVTSDSLKAEEEYRRRQDQLTIYQNATIDAQFAIDRINQRLEDIENNVVHRLELTSTNGTIFRDNNINTVIRATYYQGNEDLTDGIPDEDFIWTKKMEDGTPDTVWNEQHRGVGREIEVTHEDVQNKATFEVEVNI